MNASYSNPKLTGFDFLDFLLLFIAIYILCRLIRRYNQHRCRQIKISRRQICRLAYGGRLIPPLLIFFVMCAALILAGVFGRMSLASVIVGICVIAAYPIIYIRSVLRLERRPFLAILNHPAVKLDALAGKNFTRWGSSWHYKDDDWYILVGGGQRILLSSAMIDFDVPPAKGTEERFFVSFRTSVRQHVDGLYFCLRSGGFCFAATDLCGDDLSAWFQRER